MTAKSCCAAMMVLVLAACSGGGGGGLDAGVRRVGDTIVVEDVAGPTLVVDANGCQSILPPGGGPGEYVRDGSGNPVCTGSSFALMQRK